MTSGVYAIIHHGSGKFYIGSAVDFNTRWRKHKVELVRNRHHSIHLQRAWNKYGPDAFEFVILLTCPPDELLAREQVALGALRPAFNISPTAGSSFGIKRTPEQRARLSESLKGNTRRKGTTTSPAGIANIAAGRVGVVLPPPSMETRKKISDALTGRTLSPEHCAKISAIHKGSKRPPRTAQFRAAMAEAQRRRVHLPLSEDHRAKIAEGVRRHHANKAPQTVVSSQHEALTIEQEA